MDRISKGARTVNGRSRLRQGAKGEAKMKTAVIYARYSSDLQKDRSIDDQITHCRQLAQRHGYKVREVFVDRAKSAASMFERDGLLALMNAAKKQDFDAVITESL